MKKLLLTILGLIPLLAGAQEQVLTDLAGRQVKLTKNIQRIVAIESNEIYELDALLGADLAKKIVGWGDDLEKKDHDAWLKYTEKFPSLKTITNVGNVQKNAVSPEYVASLRPDIIIVQTYTRDQFPCMQKMEAAGLPVFYIDWSGDPLTSSQKSVALLGKALGKEARANEIVDFVNQKYKSTFAKLAQIAKPYQKVYFESGDEGPNKIGDTYAASKTGTYDSWGAVMKAMPVVNVADGVVSGMAPVSAEFILTTNPDVIVFSGKHWTTEGSLLAGYYTDEATSQKLLKAYLDRPGWKNLKAVTTKRVYVIHHNYCMHIFGYAGFLAISKAIYPDSFKEQDPKNELEEFHKKFLSVSYSGLWTYGLK